MPYGKYASKRRTYRKVGSRPARIVRQRPKRFRRYNSARRAIVASPNRPFWKNPLPNQAYYKFRYQDSAFVVTPTEITGQTIIQFRGNSLNDPDYTGVGVQPYGYDQLCGANCPFAAYRVYASKIKITPFALASIPLALRFAVWPSRDQITTYTEFEDVSQIPGHRLMTIKDAGEQKGSLVAYWTTNRIFGKGSVVDKDCSAFYNANPVRSWIWNVLCDSVDEGSASLSTTCDVRITYYALLGRGDDINES